MAEGAEETRARSNARTTASLRKKVGAQWHWDWMLRGYYLMREQNTAGTFVQIPWPELASLPDML